MKDSKFYNVLFIFLGFLLASSVQAQFDVDVRQRLQVVDEDIESTLSSELTNLKGTVSLLPIAGDQGNYIAGLLKNAITSSGLDYVEGSSDPFWDAVLTEVEWDERKADMLDSQTLTVFGKLKATQNLMYGVVREASKSGNRVYVEIELHLSSVATKQHLWGKVFTDRYYLTQEQVGLVKLEPEVRYVLKDAIDQGVIMIKQAPRLTDSLKVAIMPLAGDIDNYATELVQNMLSNTQLLPKRFSAGTRAETIELIRTDPKLADAVLYGSLRDLSSYLERVEFNKKIFQLSAEIQLHIEDTKTGDILWSGNLASTQLYEVEDSWFEVAMQNKRFLVLGILGLIGLIVLAVVCKALSGAMTRVR